MQEEEDEVEVEEGEGGTDGEEQWMNSLGMSAELCVAVCCSVLQRVAACCSVLQCLQWEGAVDEYIGDVGRVVCCCVLLCVAVCCSAL